MFNWRDCGGGGDGNLWLDHEPKTYLGLLDSRRGISAGEQLHDQLESSDGAIARGSAVQGCTGGNHAVCDHPDSRGTQPKHHVLVRGDASLFWSHAGAFDMEAGAVTALS